MRFRVAFDGNLARGRLLEAPLLLTPVSEVSAILVEVGAELDNVGKLQPELATLPDGGRGDSAVVFGHDGTVLVAVGEAVGESLALFLDFHVEGG